MDVWSLPGIDIMHDVAMRTRDGVELRSDIYLPAGGAPAPALLLRTPYGKRNVFNQGYAHPAWYVSRGYVVVCQDVRGRWDSGGEFYPYANESGDGVDTIDWIAAQRWCSGAVGMYGFSYGGATQLLAAAEAPAALLAAAPGMTGSSYCEGWTYRNGALNHAFILSWAAELAMDQALRAGDEASAAALADIVSHPAELYARLPVREAIPEALRAYAPYLDHWFDHPVYDDFWKQWSPRERYDQMTFAGLHIGGWYDIFLEPTIENFNALTRRGGAHQMLVVGPWYHMPWSQRVGDVDFGAEGRNLIDDLQIRFFDRWLRGERNGIEEEEPVRLFVMGTKRWLTAHRWPPDGTNTMILHLSSDGRANSLNGTGRLRHEPAGGEAPPDAYPADPHLPIVSLGGRSCCNANIAPMGPADQRPEEARNDVLVYDGDLLDSDLLCVGEPDVILAFACDCPTTDVVARLVDVHPDGTAINVSDGITRLSETNEGRVVEVNLTLSPTAICFQAGHRIRLEVTGSSFPMHDRNPNAAVDPLAATARDFRVATHFVFHDARHASRLRLPILDG